MSPEHCLMLERWQGPPHANRVKQYEAVSSLCLGINKFAHEDLSLLIKSSIPIHSAYLIQLKGH